MVYPIYSLVEQALNQQGCETAIIGAGATSVAWRIQCGSDAFIVRMMLPDTDRPITYRSEFAILRALFSRKLPVPEALSNSFEQLLPLNASLPPWAITRPVSGQPSLKDRLPSTAAAQLGSCLAVLHRLPCTGYGRLVETSSVFQGQYTTQIEGIRGRWSLAGLWPFDESSLSQHPIAQLAPEMVNRLEGTQSALWRIATDAQGVINHSDLHGEHIFVENDALSGVIDFGAAFIGVPGWDFAVLAYYHGWATVEEIMTGYSQPEAERHQILRQAYHLAVVVSLYKLQKAVAAQSDIRKFQEIAKFLDETLLLL